MVKCLRTPTESPRQVLSLRLSRPASVAVDNPSAPHLAGRSGRNSSSERCVGSVESAFALRSVVRPPVMRTPASSPSPKGTLLGVFQKLKRAARSQKFLRLSERLNSSGAKRVRAVEAPVSRLTRVSLH